MHFLRHRFSRVYIVYVILFMRHVRAPALRSAPGAFIHSFSFISGFIPFQAVRAAHFRLARARLHAFRALLCTLATSASSIRSASSATLFRCTIAFTPCTAFSSGCVPPFAFPVLRASADPRSARIHLPLFLSFRVHVRCVSFSLLFSSTFRFAFGTSGSILTLFHAVLRNRICA